MTIVIKSSDASESLNAYFTTMFVTAYISINIGFPNELNNFLKYGKKQNLPNTVTER